MDGITIVLFLVLLCLSGFFSASEIAMMSLPLHKIESLVRSGRWGAKLVQDLKKDTDRLLVAILIGNNLVNTLIASLATKIAIDVAAVSGYDESLAIGVSTGVITFLLLTFGEIIPKSFGTKNAELLATLSAYPFKFMILIFRPIIFIFEKLIQIFTGKKAHHTMSDEELESFIDLGKDAGTIDESEHKKLIGVLELDNLTAEDVMTPRVNIKGLSDEATVFDGITHYLENGHTRIPVYTGEIDKIHSFITMRDLFVLSQKDENMKRIKDVALRKVLKVPLNQPLDKLFELLQKNKKHLAIVIDEYGGVSGLVTLEDIVEEVFGDIHDETDTVHEEIKKIDDSHIVVDSTVMVDEVLEIFDLELYNIGLDVKEFSAETLGFVLTHTLERFPHHNEEIVFDVKTFNKEETLGQLLCRVIEIQDSKIGKVEVTFEKTQKS